MIIYFSLRLAQVLVKITQSKKNMEQIVLKARVRDKTIRANSLRRMKLVPAEYYGRGVENMSLQIPYGDIRRAYKQAGGNTIIDLDVDGKSLKALVHHVDYHPVTDDISHVEFINVDMSQAIQTRVKIKLEGMPLAVKDLQGTLVQNLHEIEIKCLPSDLIHEVVLNVEPLVDFNISLKVSDLKLPETIKLLTDPSITVATVVAPRDEEEEKPAEEVDLSKIEVTSEKKVEEGAEGAEAAKPEKPEKAEKKEKKE